MTVVLPIDPGSEPRPDPLLIRATLRMNARIFGLILGLMTAVLLLALAVAAAMPALAPTRLPVLLLAVFLPGYAPGFAGGLAGAVSGGIAGGLIGASVYWINARTALATLDRQVEFERRTADFPAAALRLNGLALGLAVGAIGALGLFVASVAFAAIYNRLARAGLRAHG
jgi:hypothetical protein